MTERRRFLDEDFIIQRVSLEQVQALLRPLPVGRPHRRSGPMSQKASSRVRGGLFFSLLHAHREWLVSRNHALDDMDHGEGITAFE